MQIGARALDARWPLVAAGLLLAAATALGAMGAHALKSQLSVERLAIYDTAVRYHFLHALGLLAIGVVLRMLDSDLVRGSAIAITAGIVMFSGSLYLLAFGLPPGSARIVGLATPVGGLLLIAGWIAFAVAILRL
jgi:uncharacterized membrane protein YgdD (TMEM256/DUF423 family)